MSDVLKSHIVFYAQVFFSTFVITLGGIIAATPAHSFTDPNFYKASSLLAILNSAFGVALKHLWEVKMPTQLGGRGSK